MPLPSSWGAAVRCPRLSRGPRFDGFPGAPPCCVRASARPAVRFGWSHSGLFLPSGCLAKIARQPETRVNSKICAARARFRRINNAAIVNSALIFQNTREVFLNLIQKTSGRLCQFSPGQRNKTSVYFVAFAGAFELAAMVPPHPTQQN